MEIKFTLLACLMMHLTVFTAYTDAVITDTDLVRYWPNGTGSTLINWKNQHLISCPWASKFIQWKVSKLVATVKQYHSV